MSVKEAKVLQVFFIYKFFLEYFFLLFSDSNIRIYRFEKSVEPINS